MKALPKSVGACADLLHDLRERRLKLQKQVDAAQAEETRLKDHIINTLPKGDTGAAGKHHKVAVVVKRVPTVVDWEKFYEHVRKTKAFELLQRRPSDAAIAERWEVGKVVPGVEPRQVVTVSLTKV